MVSVRGKKDINKPGACNLGSINDWGCWQRCTNFLGEFARLQSGTLGKDHRQIAREITMIRISGSFDLNGNIVGLTDHALFFERRDRLAKQLANFVAHRYGPKIDEKNAPVN